MNILHITPSSNGYEVVQLIANKVDKTNGLAVISINGELNYTGGFLIEDNAYTRNILNVLPKSMQYEFIKNIRAIPFEKEYLNK